jgi:YVTN family beta-propeller protein
MKQLVIRVGVKPVDITINEVTNKIYVANSGSDTVSVIDGINNNKIEEFPVGNFPYYISLVERNYMYVANYGSDTVSVIDLLNNTKIDIFIEGSPTFFYSDPEKSRMYVVSENPGTVTIIDSLNNTALLRYPLGETSYLTSISTYKDEVYVTNYFDSIVYVLSSITHKVIATISVGGNPSYIAVDENQGIAYVANSGSDYVTAVNTSNYMQKAIPVGANPSYIAVDENQGIAYVANSGSDTISIIQNSTSMAGVAFNINPPDSGHVKCNEIDIPTNQYIYLDFNTECYAQPNKGFRFNSWIENLDQNSKRTIKVSEVTDSPFTSIQNLLRMNITDPSTKFEINKFGNFTTNFVEVPPPIPSEYLIGLYTIVASTIVGWSIPSIIGWVKSKGDIRKLNFYHNQINTVYEDKKLDENDVKSLDDIQKNIINEYSRGHLNNEHYVNLKNEISILYEEIFTKRISGINNLTINQIKLKLLKEIKKDIDDAFSKEKINEKHYNLLKEKISEIENKNKSNNN